MSELISAIKMICDEKGLSYDAVISTIESALAAAYRKDYGEKNQNIKVEFSPDTAESKVFDVKTVVDDVPEEELDENGDPIKVEEVEKPELAEGEEEVKRFNPKTDLQITEAKLIKKDAKIGEEIITELAVPSTYGRMAAQTAKQVIIQRLREAERDMVMTEFKDKEKEVVSGVVQRREGRVVLVDLGKTVGILPQDEQIYGENYAPGERIKVFIKEVRTSSKGPEIILSRTSDEILRKVFYLEIPEISNGLIELKSVAREAGSRSKVAVHTESDNVDPIGSCVGQRGSRIQTVISELGGEKVDIVQYDENPEKYITNALSPAKILSITTNEEEKKAIAHVNEDQLSLAIGKGGQNARLAARLTGWKIDVVMNDGEDVVKKDDEEVEEDNSDEEKKEKDEVKAEKKDTSTSSAQGKKEKKEKKDTSTSSTPEDGQAAQGKKEEKTEKKDTSASSAQGKKEEKTEKKDTSASSAQGKKEKKEKKDTSTSSAQGKKEKKETK
ncbi:MAG: transcription termination factor NusA [Patescibacteria group bacterium]|jgi:N utilization substance protein A|nr:transcription termination factor NusA [Patescibacteria group bacterium]